MEIVRPIVQECFIPSQYTSFPKIIKNCLQEVFTEEEEKRLKELAAAEFAEHPNRTAALAVLINFSLGLRVGELVALKWKDLKDSYLHI